MRKRPVSFRAEVTRRFQFLVDRHGFDGPDYSELLLPLVAYIGAGLRVSIFFHEDARDGAGRRISTVISLDTEHGLAKADLGDLVEAAVFAPRHHVAGKAHTADAIRSTLDDNAKWVERLMPVLRGADAHELIRRAARHETDKAGNPKRRPSGVKWKFAQPQSQRR